MEFGRTSNGYFLKLKKGAKVMASLREFASSHQIPSAKIVGLGAVKNATLAFYELERRAYLEKVFEDDMELLNLTGNLSWLNNQAFAHCHVTLSGQDFKAVGGHLMEAEIAVAGEFFIFTQDLKIVRKMDPEIGLNSLSLCPMG